VLRGALAASVTPLRDSGAELDPEPFPALLDFFAAAGLDGILALGTTGEGIALTVAERRRAQAYHRGMRDMAAFETAQADLGVKEATLREEIARAALASAEEGVRLLTSRYENHLGRMVDLLDAQTALDVARAARIRAGNDVRRSRAQRLYASGGLLSFAAPEEYGKEKIR